MDARVALRSARHLAGLSQRALAELAGVAPSTVAAIEAGTLRPRWDLVSALLGTCGIDVSFAERDASFADRRAGAGEPEGRGDDLADDLAEYLALSTSSRLYWSLGGRLSTRSRQDCPTWQELASLARRATVVLAPESCPGVWIPEYRPPEPLPVLVSPRGASALPDGLDRVRVVGPAPDLRGTVPVGVGAAWHVHVLPPLAPALQRDPSVAARLRAAMMLLVAQETRDQQGRGRAAHRAVDVRSEYEWVMTRRRFSSVKAAAPDARDRRDWRIGGAASFRQWLTRSGYPIERYGHAEKGP